MLAGAATEFIDGHFFFTEPLNVFIRLILLKYFNKISVQCQYMK